MVVRIESGEMPIKGRVAMTGRPGVGKTTAIERLLRILPLSAGGLITKEIRVCGHRVGFSLVDIATGEEGVLAHLHHRTGPKVGRYTVDLRSLEEIGIRAIRRAIDECELVVIDEIAPMELTAPGFVPAVEEALASDKSLLISTHAHTDHPLAHRVRRELALFRVKLSNRDGLIAEIAAHFGVTA
jgi:nucleoside-triphosphatase